MTMIIINLISTMLSMTYPMTNFNDRKDRTGRSNGAATTYRIEVSNRIWSVIACTSSLRYVIRYVIGYVIVDQPCYILSLRYIIIASDYIVRNEIVGWSQWHMKCHWCMSLRNYVIAYRPQWDTSATAMRYGTSLRYVIADSPLPM